MQSLKRADLCTASTAEIDLPSVSAGRILTSVGSSRQMIQDFRPLAESIDWELGQIYWEVRGSESFTSHEVPFTINNDGSLSANAASLLFQNLLESESHGALEEQIRVLDLGVGIGLFARFFLDNFRRLCAEQGKDYYDRLRYVTADASHHILEDLGASGILSDHIGRYEIQRIDATELKLSERDNFRAVFLNYVLDSLPAALLKVDGSSVDQLYLRTYLARCTNLQEHTKLSIAEILQCVSSPDRKAKRELIDLFHLFSLDGEFRPVTSAMPYLAHAIEFSQHYSPPYRYVLHNYGAIECLDKLLSRLHVNGFILMSDYGITSSAEVNESYTYQHFGASTAVGLNFELVSTFFKNRQDCSWIEPEGDNPRIYTRLLGHEVSDSMKDRFSNQFSRAAYEQLNQAVETARQNLTDGRREAALISYREALERQPYNWVLLGEVARLVSAGLHEHEAGLELAQRALAINPVSAELWNTVGDCLVYLERLDEAERAFREALRLSPHDAGAEYSLIHILIRKNEPEAALRLIAKTFVDDRTGEYRERLIQRQGEILSRLDHVKQQRAQTLVDRFSGIVTNSSEPGQID